MTELDEYQVSFLDFLFGVSPELLVEATCALATVAPVFHGHAIGEIVTKYLPPAIHSFLVGFVLVVVCHGGVADGVNFGTGCDKSQEYDG